MRISGIESSSVILGQTKKFKNWSEVPNMPNQAKSKRDGEINPQNYNFRQF